VITLAGAMRNTSNGWKNAETNITAAGVHGKLLRADTGE